MINIAVHVVVINVALMGINAAVILIIRYTTIISVTNLWKVFPFVIRSVDI